jgi:hypothetical protein
VSQLFIHPYLDEDVSILVAKLIRSRAFDATACSESGMTGASDAQQLAFAAERRMTLVTHNRVDFEQLAKDYLVTGRHHNGNIIAVRRPANELATRLLTILNAVAADEMDDQLLYI